MAAGWRPWRVLRDADDIEFALVDLPAGLRAVCGQRGPDRAILVDRRLPQAERKVALAHELVHLERGIVVTTAGLPEPMRVYVLREERAVDGIVADRLVPPEQLELFAEARAEVEAVTPCLVAEEFGVDEATARRALEALARRRGAA